jgi:hypothetical protein
MPGRIWKVVGVEPSTRAQKVLSRCDSSTVDCWRSANRYLRLAAFLRFHGEHGDPDAAGHAKLCIAYESYHPAPMRFTRRLRVVGGALGSYDPDEVLEIPAGRNQGRTSRSEVLPQWVGVQRQREGGAQIAADVDVVANSPAFDDEPFALSITFPEGVPPCSCC